MHVESENYLNQCYGDDYLQLMFRDSKCLYCYFEVSDGLIAMVCRHFGGKSHNYPLQLRLINTGNYQVLVTQSLEPLVNNWFFETDCQPGNTYQAELGVLIGAIFFPLLKSNVISLPALPSPIDTQANADTVKPSTSQGTARQQPTISSAEFIKLEERKGAN